MYVKQAQNNFLINLTHNHETHKREREREKYPIHFIMFILDKLNSVVKRARQYYYQIHFTKTRKFAFAFVLMCFGNDKTVCLIMFAFALLCLRPTRKLVIFVECSVDIQTVYSQRVDLDHTPQSLVEILILTNHVLKIWVDLFENTCFGECSI